MNLIDEHNKKYDFFRDITGEAMRVHRKYHPDIIIELKAVKHVDTPHRLQLWNYMRLTH